MKKRLLKQILRYLKKQLELKVKPIKGWRALQSKKNKIVFQG